MGCVQCKDKEAAKLTEDRDTSLSQSGVGYRYGVDPTPQHYPSFSGVTGVTGVSGVTAIPNYNNFHGAGVTQAWQSSEGSTHPHSRDAPHTRRKTGNRHFKQSQLPKPLLSCSNKLSVLGWIPFLSVLPLPLPLPLRLTPSPCPSKPSGKR